VTTGSAAWSVPPDRWSGQPCRYPDPCIQSLDRRFDALRLGSASVERLHTGGRWVEGPVWFGDGRFLLWSDIPNDRMLRWREEDGDVSVFRAPSRHSNGNTRDLQGRLVTCEHGSRSVTRTELDGRVTVLVDRADGRRLNAPNDVVVAADGAIWFTDPGYGILGDYEGAAAEFELPRRVYRLDPASGSVEVAADDFDRPNGICFSPDGSRLYVGDTGASHSPGGPAHVRVFRVQGASLEGGEVFAEMSPGLADGMRTDRYGNLWVAAGWGGEGYDGVHCFAPDGTPLGRIHLPEPCSNLCFGGVRRNRLFMTAGTSLYAVFVNTVGAQRP
jgi:gluconolactonase